MDEIKEVAILKSEVVLSNLEFTYWLNRSRFDPRQRRRIFPLASVSRPALRPTQPPVQWVPGVLSQG